MERNKRTAEGDYEVRDTKRFKESEESNPMVPMEFGTNKYKRSHQDDDYDTNENYQQNVHFSHANNIGSYTPKGKGVHEERINVKDLYKLEKEQEAEFDTWKK